MIARPANQAALACSGATGPRTAEGKAISCLNHWKHGLTGIFRVHESESQSRFDELRNALRTEHKPGTATEILLVDRMAEHVWLSQRAGRLVDAAIGDHNERWFALMLRYGTTHDRAFHKCLAELRTLRRERDRQPERQDREFESQNAVASAPHASPEFESQKRSKYTAAELDRLSPAEISQLVQTALREANIDLDTLAQEALEAEGQFESQT